MSRREDRSSESKRHRSRIDRERSPKRSRRDGKLETERPPTEASMDSDRANRDQLHQRRLQEPLPLESGAMSKESEKVGDGHEGVVKHSSDPTKIPHSRPYFQHDGRALAGQNGRGFSYRTADERRRWRESKEQRNDKAVSVNAQQKDEKSEDNREGSHGRRHDGHFEMEANPKLAARKRPAFREQRIPADVEKTNKAGDDPVKPKPQDHARDSGRRNLRGYGSRYSNKPERPVAGEREMNRAQPWRGNFPSGNRSDHNSRYRGRDRVTAKQGYVPSGGRVEKWKHDLYNEANRSPTPKNEEEQIARIEALLAS